MSEQQAPIVDTPPVIGPGKMLKDARIAQGLSVADIATKVHLKVTNIEAIEDDQFDENISLTFTKGYLKLYAKHVGIAESDILQAFANLQVEEKEPAKLQSFSKRVAKQANDDRLMLITYVIIAVLLALVVVWWFQQDLSDTTFTVDEPTETAEQLPDTDANIDTETLPPTADDLIVSANLAPQETAEATDISDDAVAIEPAVNDAPVNTLDDELAAASTETSATPEQSLSVSGNSQAIAEPIELVFEFAGDCWMNLTDSTGNAIAFGVKKSGYVMAVDGFPPFDVTLGAPGVVKIMYDGVQVDMSQFDAGQTARFSLPFAQL